MAAKLWRGSTGDSVRDLQRKLNANGYELDEDGVFGNNTYNAVVDYQRKYNLRVDGVVGEETWGSLLKTTEPEHPTTGKEILQGVSDETYDALHRLEQGFTPSDEAAAAREVQKSLEAVQPGAYRSSFEGELARLYDQITGREAFSYDPQTDAQAKNYAYLYARKGREAMADTMGAAAALTGGYGSSYAQTVSQQAYERYMQQLMELMPELEKNARQQDESRRQWLAQQYEWASDREQADYKRHQQEQAAWQESYDRSGREADALWDREYADYKLMLQHYTTMANAEQKASDGTRANTGAAAQAEKKPILSSTAMESLQRALGNYLKGGRTDQAAALARQYSSRMTAAQKQKLQKIFGEYGAELAAF